MDIGKNMSIAVSQPTVSRSIQIIDIVSRPKIMNQWIKFPSTLIEFNELRTQYEFKYIFKKYVFLYIYYTSQRRSSS